MKHNISKSGLLLVGIFLVFSGYYLFLAFSGAWQATIFISLATLPFSIGVNVFCDWLQDAMHLSNQAASTLEIAITCLVGIVEFYAIGCAIDFVRRRGRKVS